MKDHISGIPFLTCADREIDQSETFLIIDLLSQQFHRVSGKQDHLAILQTGLQFVRLSLQFLQSDLLIAFGP